jgi:hypothetical protein
MAVVDEVAPYRFTVNGRQLPYARTHSISGTHPLVTHGIIVVHGASKTAESIMNAVVDGVEDTGRSTTNVAVISPQFLEDEDMAPHSIDTATHHYWTNAWRQGNTSVNGSTSSYTVLDYLVTQLMDIAKFPNLTRITMTGHSAGGQVAARYSGGGIAPRAGVAIKYVIANPSSYMYLTQERPVGRSTTNFAIPSGVSASTYNSYAYGMLSLNSYMSAVGSNQIITNYAERDIDVILGEDDIEQDSDLDTSTAANFQGFNRFERGQAWFNHLVRQVGVGSHDIWTVPNVGHTFGGMYRSQVGRESLFIFDEVVAPPPPPIVRVLMRNASRPVWGRNDRWGGSLASRQS